MHTVGQPFLTREGQFKPKEKSEAIGILQEALMEDGDYEFAIEGRDFIYYAKVKDIREFIAKHESWYVNKFRKRVGIVPVDFFQVRDLPQLRLL